MEFPQSSADVGIYFGDKEISQVGGRILLPYSGITKYLIILINVLHRYVA